MLLVRPPGVYRAQEDTSLLRQVLRRRGRRGLVEGRSVLDIGSGTGALGIEAFRAGAADLTAIDLSRRSVLTSWLNSRLHGIPATVRRGDLFSPVNPHRFDLVLANPPYVPTADRPPSRHRMARCWDAGPDGRVLLDRICAGAPSALDEDGTLLVVQSGIAGEQATLDRCEEAGLVAETVARARIPFGPVLRARVPELRTRGLLGPDQVEEELVVIEARHG
ncbi:HemK2/MTQ2 family protein methyltransferase [Nocardiopsis kunsanensis]|uniref:Methyltransferase n=1 Tax=Nocardiopsis kunsanensis TaxID=141693 RepID=A0A918XE19_9ACTN|nr:HemK2/MTQ2 family protein methyltransferase [Nocardiopsis kunsanensis]GHD26930.1 methyltransferase [Nocardiopsis kunsanensis]